MRPRFQAGLPMEADMEFHSLKWIQFLLIALNPWSDFIAAVFWLSVCWQSWSVTVDSYESAAVTIKEDFYPCCRLAFCLHCSRQLLLLAHWWTPCLNTAHKCTKSKCLKPPHWNKSCWNVIHNWLRFLTQRQTFRAAARITDEDFCAVKLNTAHLSWC